MMTKQLSNLTIGADAVLALIWVFSLIMLTRCPSSFTWNMLSCFSLGASVAATTIAWLGLRLDMTARITVTATTFIGCVAMICVLMSTISD